MRSGLVADDAFGDDQERGPARPAGHARIRSQLSVSIPKSHSNSWLVGRIRHRRRPATGNLAQSAAGVAGRGQQSSSCGKQFKRVQDMAAWLGLTPRQHSRGGKERLLGISQRGDAYLRTLLIHGARVLLKVAGQKDDPRSRWLQTLSERRSKNIAAVALANKHARIAWFLLAGC